METIYQNQHFVSQVLLRRFTTDGHLYAFDIATEKWKRLSPKKIFSQNGYTQLLANGQIDNTLEDEFGKVETQLPKTLAALDNAAQNPTTELTVEAYENMCWYCAFLWRVSPFSKAKAPADFVMQLNLDLDNGKTYLLKHVLGFSDDDIATIKTEHARGKKVIIDSKDFLQLVYRIQFVLRCKEDFAIFRYHTKWAVWNSPIELPISDVALVQVHLRSHETSAFVLPIAPRLLLVGTIKIGPQQRSNATVIKSHSFKTDEAEYWRDAICLAAQATLASQNIIPDVPTMRKRATKEVNFVKIVNPESLIKAGVTDFTGKFGIRMVSNDELVKFINMFVKK